MTYLSGFARWRGTGWLARLVISMPADQDAIGVPGFAPVLHVGLLRSEGVRHGLGGPVRRWWCPAACARCRQRSWTGSQRSHPGHASHFHESTWSFEHGRVGVQVEHFDLINDIIAAQRPKSVFGGGLVHLGRTLSTSGSRPSWSVSRVLSSANAPSRMFRRFEQWGSARHDSQPTDRDSLVSLSSE